MGGKPAARQGDMTRKGLDIVQGSAGVRRREWPVRYVREGLPMLTR